MNNLYQLAAAHTAYFEYGHIQVVGHYNEDMTRILGVIFYSPYNVKISVSRICFEFVPRLAALVAVVV